MSPSGRRFPSGRGGTISLEIFHVPAARVRQSRRPRGLRGALAATRIRAAAAPGLFRDAARIRSPRVPGARPRRRAGRAAAGNPNGDPGGRRCAGPPGFALGKSAARCCALRVRPNARPRPAAVDAARVAELRSAGVGDEQVLEAVLASGLGRLLATLAAGLGSRAASPPIPRAPAAVALEAPHLAAAELSPSDFAPFAALQKAFGFVPRLYRAQTSKPEAVEAEAMVLRDVLLAEDHLSRVQKERILLAVSDANRNEYGVALHDRVLQLLGSSRRPAFPTATAPCSRWRANWRIELPTSETPTGAAGRLRIQRGADPRGRRGHRAGRLPEHGPGGSRRSTRLPAEEKHPPGDLRDESFRLPGPSNRR